MGVFERLGNSDAIPMTPFSQTRSGINDFSEVVQRSEGAYLNCSKTLILLVGNWTVSILNAPYQDVVVPRYGYGGIAS